MFQVLADNKLLNEDNLPLYRKMVSMRNKIINDYERISKEVLYMVISENLSDFDITIEDLKRNMK